MKTKTQLNTLSQNSTKEFYQPPVVVVLPPDNPTAKVAKILLPYGKKLKIEKTRTMGIEEAIIYANNEGWDVFIFGHRDKVYTYKMNGSLKLPPMQGKTIRISGANLEFPFWLAGPAITFDSTMMVDFSIDGKVIAKNSRAAIQFYPRGMHPLDGVKHKIPGGVVDSRFAFHTLEAKAGFHFNTSKAIVTDCLFSIKNGITRITKTGIGYTNSIMLYRSWQPISFSRKDALSPEAVIVEPPIGPIGTAAVVKLARGGKIQTIDYRTEDKYKNTIGVQKAFDIATKKRLPLFIYGRGLQANKISFERSRDGEYPTNGFYNITQPLSYRAVPNARVHIFNVTFNFDLSKRDERQLGRNPTLLTLYGNKKIKFELTGQLVAHHSNGIDIISNKDYPLSEATIHIGHVQSAANGPDGIKRAAAVIDAQSGDTKDNFFLFTELLSGDFGLTINNPGINANFVKNKVLGVHVHGQINVGVQIGQNRRSSPHVANNFFRFGINPDDKSLANGIQVWGQENHIRGSFFGSKTDRSFSLEKSSRRNHSTSHRWGKGEIFNEGKGNTFGRSTLPIIFENSPLLPN